MSLSFLDNPFILSMAFYPRKARPGDGPLGGAASVFDGTIPVEGDVVLGYRLYAHDPGAPVILYYHGNAAIAIDYDDLAPYYHHYANVSLLVVEFRGFGWSTGTPGFAALLSDAHAVVDALPRVLGPAGLAECPLFIMGQSMGSAAAIHTAHEYPERFRGLIVESGFADILSIIVRLGFPAALLGNRLDPIGNERKMRRIHLPLLVVHGEQDRLIPVGHGQRLHDASPAAQKRLLRVAGAGHNDVIAVGFEAYFSALARFVEDHAGSG